MAAVSEITVKFRVQEGQIGPGILPGIVTYFDHECSRIPDRIRVSFEDGTTAVYELKIEQPHPIIAENIKIIRKWKQGYVNQPERRRRRK